MEIKMVGAHKIKDKIFIRGYANTTVGVYKSDGPVFITQGEAVLQLGQHILEALRGAGKVIPHPTQEQLKEKNKEDLLLQATKMKTWNAMLKASKNVKIYLKDNRVSLTPCGLGGSSGDQKGYYPLDDKAIISDLDPETLGRSLLQAFELCE